MECGGEVLVFLVAGVAVAGRDLVVGGVDVGLQVAVTCGLFGAGLASRFGVVGVQVVVGFIPGAGGAAFQEFHGGLLSLLVDGFVPDAAVVRGAVVLGDGPAVVVVVHIRDGGPL